MEKRKNKNVIELNPAQRRQVKLFMDDLRTALTTKSEKDYFNASAKALEAFATLIQQANFAESQVSSIPYGHQALEFALEYLQESIEDSDFSAFDN